MTRLTPALLLLCAATALQAQSPPTVVATVPETDLVPEGIAWDPTTRSLFLSSTYRRKIVRIDSLGRATDFVREGQDGLWGVIGMKVDPDRGVLWAASSDAGMAMPIRAMREEENGRSGVFKFQMSTGRLVKKYLMPSSGGHFLNDLVTSGGDLYVTDSPGRTIHRIALAADTLERFVRVPHHPNGIDLTPDGRSLVVALESSIGMVDLRRRTVHVLVPPEGHRSEGGFDGLYAHPSGIIAVQPWDTGRAVVRFRLNDARDRIVGSDVVVGAHVTLEQPTTAALVGNELFLVANSHLQSFRRLYETRPDGPWPELHPATVLRASLR
jgi:sugar lactone lactonase YvrE